MSTLLAALALVFGLAGGHRTSALLCGFAIGLAYWKPPRRRWLLFGLLLVLLLLDFYSSDAHAGGWQRVRFVSPSDQVGAPVARIVGQRWTAPGPAWQPTQLWRGPGTAYGALTGARAPGLEDTAWVSTSQDPAVWRRGGTAFRLAGVTAAGDTLPWSNLELLVLGVPADTLFLDACGSAWLVPPGSPQGYQAGWRRTTRNATTPALWEATWVRAEDDTILVAPPAWPELNGQGPLVHLEALARARRCPLCGDYGYVGLRGVRDSSLCVAPCP